MDYWLLKTEPGEFSWDDLVEEGESVWDGVKNPVALKNLSSMKPGDKALIYHTGKQKAVVGTAAVTSLPYPDPQFSDPSRLVIKVAPLERLSRPVELARIKTSGMFADWALVRQPRLSVVPVSPKQWETIISWSRT